MSVQTKVEAILNPGRMLAYRISYPEFAEGQRRVSVPTPHNPDGIKVGGEGGAAGAPAAIANAIADALPGARINATPLAPARAYRAIDEAGLAHSGAAATV